MPRPKLKLTKFEAREYRDQLRQLREMGLPVGCAGDFSKPREQLRFEQVDEELAAIHALPGSGFVFVARVKQTVLASNFLLDDFEMTAAWDPLPLVLDDPETFPLYRDVIADFYPAPVALLNPWLTGKRPLRRSQREGLIIARGRAALPADCKAHAVLGINLSLWDESENEFRFGFQGGVDFRLKIKFERWLQQRKRQGHVRQPLFGPKPDGSPENRISQAPEPLFRLPVKDRAAEKDTSCNDINLSDEMNHFKIQFLHAQTNHRSQ